MNQRNNQAKYSRIFKIRTYFIYLLIVAAISEANQSISIKTRDAQADAYAVTAAHRRLSSQRRAMMTLTGPFIPWCCPSTTYAVYLCDAFRPRSPVVWSSAAYHGNRHGRTMITCDAWRLTDQLNLNYCIAVITHVHLAKTSIEQEFFRYGLEIHMLCRLCIKCTSRFRQVCLPLVKLIKYDGILQNLVSGGDFVSQISIVPSEQHYLSYFFFLTNQTLCLGLMIIDYNNNVKLDADGRFHTNSPLKFPIYLLNRTPQGVLETGQRDCEKKFLWKTVVADGEQRN